MKCPVCEVPLLPAESGNGGQLYVAEELYSTSECYDAHITMYKCENNHTIYISEDRDITLI